MGPSRLDMSIHDSGEGSGEGEGGEEAVGLIGLGGLRRWEWLRLGI